MDRSDTAMYIYIYIYIYLIPIYGCQHCWQPCGTMIQWNILSVKFESDFQLKSALDLDVINIQSL